MYYATMALSCSHASCLGVGNICQIERRTLDASETLFRLIAAKEKGPRCAFKHFVKVGNYKGRKSLQSFSLTTRKYQIKAINIQEITNKPGI